MAMFARREAGRPDQRRHPRVPFVAYGRFVLDDAIEHRCRTIDISPGGLALTAPTHAPLGQRVVCYLDQLGRLEGQVARLFDSGFALAISASPAKRDKLTQQLAWLSRAPLAVPREGRRERVASERRREVLRLPDGRRVAVTIIDLSAASAAVLCPMPVAIGTAVLLGERAAHVARVAQTVVGLQFDAPLVLARTPAAPCSEGTMGKNDQALTR